MSKKSRTESGHLVRDEYNAIPIPQRTEDRPTEDDLARAALGGPKGAPELPPAPLTKTEEEQNSPNDDPGHVA
jgi:hypothetical protein